MSRKLSLAWYLYKKQMTWALWFIGAMFIIQATIFFFNPYDTSNNINFMENIFQPACIFMIIIGVITSQRYFRYFIKKWNHQKRILYKLYNCSSRFISKHSGTFCSYYYVFLKQSVNYLALHLRLVV